MKFFNKDFFRFSLGFLGIVSLSLLFIAAVSAYAAEISQIAFTTSEQTVEQNELSEPITIQTQDGSGALLQTPETIDLEFTSNSPTGEFLGGTGKSASHVTMNKNTGNRTVYYKDSSEGTFTMTVNAKGRVSNLEWSASQSITVSGSGGGSETPPPPKKEEPKKEVKEPIVASTTPLPPPAPPPIVIPKETPKEEKPVVVEKKSVSPSQGGKEVKQTATVILSQKEEVSVNDNASTSSTVIYEEQKEEGWWSKFWNFLKNLFS